MTFESPFAPRARSKVKFKSSTRNNGLSGSYDSDIRKTALQEWDANVRIEPLLERICHLSPPFAPRARSKVKFKISTKNNGLSGSRDSYDSGIHKTALQEWYANVSIEPLDATVKADRPARA